MLNELYRYDKYQWIASIIYCYDDQKTVLQTKDGNEYEASVFRVRVLIEGIKDNKRRRYLIYFIQHDDTVESCLLRNADIQLPKNYKFMSYRFDTDTAKNLMETLAYKKNQEMGSNKSIYYHIFNTFSSINKNLKMPKNLQTFDRDAERLRGARPDYSIAPQQTPTYHLTTASAIACVDKAIEKYVDSLYTDLATTHWNERDAGLIGRFQP